MSQDFHVWQTGVDAFGDLYTFLNNTFGAVRSLFSGPGAPVSPAVHQPWLDTSAATPRLKIWDGTAWQDFTVYFYTFQMVKAELEASRGVAASLAARLGVAINADGTLKAAAPAGGWWTAEPDAVGYNGAESFLVAGDKTAIYMTGRAVSLSQTADSDGHVVSAAYDSGQDETTVAVDCTVDTGLVSVEYGQPPDNTPAVPFNASGGEWGILNLAARADHLHDDRYYTESEVNGLLSGKEDVFAKNSAFNQSFAGSGSDNGVSALVCRKDHRHPLTVIADVKAGHGGTFTSGAWRVRDLTTILVNEVGIGALVSNQFILPAGNYRVRWMSQANCVNMHRTRLFNTSTSAEVAKGTPGVANSAATIDSWSHGVALVSPGAPQSFRIEHWCVTSKNDDGFGYSTFAGDNIFTLVFIEKENN